MSREINDRRGRTFAYLLRIAKSGGEEPRRTKPDLSLFSINCYKSAAQKLEAIGELTFSGRIHGDACVGAAW
jgi:hypothetical protein